MKLTIEKEFRDLCPPLSTDERQHLHDNIKSDGVLDRIKVWDGKIIDGHNRFEIAQELGVDFDVEEMTFTSRNEVVDWIIHNQLGRRNLDPKAASYLRGKLYNERKKKTGRPSKPAGKPQNKKRGQSDPINSTAEKVADETGVSPKTVKRDGKFAKAVDELAPKARQAIQQNAVKASQKDVERLAEYEEDSQADIIETVEMGDQPTLKAALDAQEIHDDVQAEVTDVDLALEMAAEFKNHAAALTRLLTWVKEMAGGPAGRFLQEHRRQLEADIKNARQVIKFAAPHAACPYCNGEVDHETRACDACKGWGWVTKQVYDNAPAELKR